eukprot:scaffold57385_cov65-Phaeocystis_antarctica.AAC.4
MAAGRGWAEGAAAASAAMAGLVASARWLPRWRWCSALRLCYVTSYDSGKQEPARTAHRDYVEEPVLRRLATFEAASGTGWPTVATTSNSFQCPNERHQTCTRGAGQR